MKMIIADDELIERKGMRKFISESFKHIEVVGEAANGRVAIEQAKKHKPDVMIMDIQMPGIDGLEAIRQILAEQPHIKFIMVSAFDSFDYAKEAMKLGVKEYILKPSNKQETIEAILRVGSEINEMNQLEEQRKNQLIESEKLAKRQIISAIIQNEITFEIERMYQHFFPHAHMAYFQVITSSDPKAVIDFLNKKSTYSWMIKELGDKLIVLFITGKHSAHHVKADSLSHARTMIHLLPSPTIIGIGSPFIEIDKLIISYQQALLASAQFTMGASVTYGFPLLDDKKDGTIRKLEKTILNELIAGRVEQAIDYFQLYYEQINRQKNVTNIIQTLREWGIRLKQLLEDEGTNLLDFSVLSASSKEDFVELIRQFGERVFIQREGNNLISKAKSYIHDHYQQPLSLEDVAGNVGLTPTYFTKMFKEHTEQTFIDYVTDYRIEKSKELLLQTNLSLKEIAFKVGYDPNYFSRVFKKWTNLSPKQYRSTTK
jgi:two-component system response regulator YesN